MDNGFSQGFYYMGSFTNYVYKPRGVGSQRIYKVENVNGVGGHKKSKSCQSSL
jgi:hypothetical protein